MNENPTSRTTPSPDWESLRLLNSYRLFVVIVLLVGFLAAPGDIAFGHSAPEAFHIAITAYAILALLFAISLRRRRPDYQTQCHLHFYTDIILLGVAIYASGGVSSGLGILLVIPVAGAGTLLQARYSLVYAALAAVMLLTSEVLFHMQAGAAAAAYTQAALLGIALFATAFLARLLALRQAQSTALARQRSIDLQRLAALNEQIIQQMEAGILVVSADGRITLANASAKELLGRPGEIADRPLAELSSQLETAMRSHRQSGRNPPHPVRVHRDDERSRRLQVQFTDLGEQGTMMMLEDAAFIEHQVQQLKLASLGRLTAGVAHEIRNPLAAINHSAQLLAESGRDQADARLVEIQLEHCRRINAIIESVLQLSRSGPGDRESIDLGEWLEIFVAEFRAHHRLSPDRMRLERNSNFVVSCHSGQLRQILTNLCENCLQHGRTESQGPVCIRVRMTRTQEGNAVIDIIDNGLPIPREQLEDLFEPFFTTSRTGTGLGLYLARELCEANDAELRYVTMETGNCLRIEFRGSEALMEPA